MPEQQKTRAKGRKIGRNKKHQAGIYRSTDRLEKNRKRRLRRHLRNHPLDVPTAALFDRDCGGLQSIGSSGRARRRAWKQAHPWLL